MKRAFLVTFLFAAFLVAEVENLCTEDTIRDLTRDEKQYMVRLHNEKRNQVASGQVAKQPKATNMRELVISKNLLYIVKPRPKTLTPKGPAPTQSNPVKIRFKGTGADTKILWATTNPPHHPITFLRSGWEQLD